MIEVGYTTWALIAVLCVHVAGVLMGARARGALLATAAYAAIIGLAVWQATH